MIFKEISRLHDLSVREDTRAPGEFDDINMGCSAIKNDCSLSRFSPPSPPKPPTCYMTDHKWKWPFSCPRKDQHYIHCYSALMIPVSCIIMSFRITKPLKLFSVQRIDIYYSILVHYLEFYRYSFTLYLIKFCVGSLLVFNETPKIKACLFLHLSNY